MLSESLSYWDRFFKRINFHNGFHFKSEANSQNLKFAILENEFISGLGAFITEGPYDTFVSMPTEDVIEADPPFYAQNLTIYVSVAIQRVWRFEEPLLFLIDYLHIDHMTFFGPLFSNQLTYYMLCSTFLVS